MNLWTLSVTDLLRKIGFWVVEATETQFNTARMDIKTQFEKTN